MTFDTPPHRGPGPIKDDMASTSIRHLIGGRLELRYAPVSGATAPTRRIWLEFRYAALSGAPAQTRRIWLELDTPPNRGRSPVKEDVA